MAWDPAFYHEIISDRRRGLFPALLQGALWSLSLPYGMATWWRNRRFDRRRRRIHRIGIPVVSVGNLTLGGTGKTPVVAYLCRDLLDKGHAPAWISRGYRATDEQGNDEARELLRRLPEVPYAVNPDRVAAAERLQEEHSIDCLVLDDAFQHRRIARDLDLVLLDALAPFGHGHLFPRGLLRESLRSLGRADLVLLSRADMVSGERIREITESVRRYAPSMQVVPITHQPRALAPWEGDAAPLDSFDGKSVLAFCGLGNPDGFRHTLHRLGMRLVGFETFPDHHEYNQADRSRLEQLARKQGADALVCTMKDLVKIQRNELAGLPLRAVEIGIGFPDGDAPLQEKIDRLFPRG